MNFREDINGLRAFAVIAVMIFHFNESWLTGGFAGVDVFFVISGFLMTKITLNGIEKENSIFLFLKKFYAARVKRIVPALLVLVILLSVTAFLFFEPSRNLLLSSQGIPALGFFSNFYFWQHSNGGYFATSPSEKELLHTWSLSVEWQFYMLYPFIIWIVSKLFKKKQIRRVILALTILALSVGLIIAYNTVNAGYFVLPTRMWEMMVGGIAFLFPWKMSSPVRKSAEYIGIGLMNVSFFIISRDFVWPGIGALLPVFSSFLVIQAANNSSWITANPAVRYIGKWSYSLYLYHWPIVALNNSYHLEMSFWIYLFLSFVFGAASYYLVEQKKWKLWLIAVLWGVTILGLYASKRTGGFKFRIPKEVLYQDNPRGVIKPDGTQYTNMKKSVVGGADFSNYDYMIVSDSYGQQYARFLDENHIKTLTWFSRNCMKLPHYSQAVKRDGGVFQKECAECYPSLSADLKANTRPVLFIYSWDSYHLRQKDDFSSYPVTYKENKKKYLDILEKEWDEIIANRPNPKSYNIYFVGVPNKPGFPVRRRQIEGCLPLSRLLFGECPREVEEKPLDINNEMKSLAEKFAKKYSNIYYIDPEESLCKNHKCKVLINGHPVYEDIHGHLSHYGAEYIGKNIMDQVRKNEKK
ncbi:acyltransferase family protein [Riemerella columbipharyngis]|uniref:Peptidoglycan/LPS O-acetylase OafA/YrhL, contains acyltransferase and SGNH-hydrolase domains n=1 Tax=Riemerella columbipharyngis TaxID=1071918 RepID=A0A1G7A9V4_9FLAO|nr:acyltransferase family protein [Riemerella columbipharyngis]SDE11674.1 Peptidoglycan/LPS O-acetylase OafA/YrhL, contains acyltransferase and SGNH-hydrolase domains [Riemerella columbipharyngis]